MRDIIFRGKRLDNGEWVEGDYFRKYIYDRYDNGSLHHLIGWQVTDNDGEKFNDYEDVDPDTVGQYTGMKDRAGKMIWEDDIMLIPETDFNAEIIGRVIYEEDAYYIIPLHGGHLWGLCWSLRKHNAKIIGNFHDHPDLLK